MVNRRFLFRLLLDYRTRKCPNSWPDVSPDVFELVYIELGAEVVQNGVFVGCIFASLTECRDLVDVFSIKFSIVTEAKSNFLVKRVDEKIKKLVLMECTVCLLVLFGHIFSKQTSQLTGFVKY